MQGLRSMPEAEKLNYFDLGLRLSASRSLINFMLNDGVFFSDLTEALKIAKDKTLLTVIIYLFVRHIQFELVIKFFLKIFGDNPQKSYEILDQALADERCKKLEKKPFEKVRKSMKESFAITQTTAPSTPMPATPQLEEEILFSFFSKLKPKQKFLSEKSEIEPEEKYDSSPSLSE